jgi:hypothetical protein
MSVGVVKLMYWWKFKTPSKGILVDIETGIEYAFTRPPITSTSTTKIPVWNVKTHDCVTFTIVGNIATEVTLLHKHRKGRTFVRNV